MQRQQQHAPQGGAHLVQLTHKLIDRNDLVAALQGGSHLVQLAHELGHRVGGVQRLVGVHIASAVGVACHLPPRAVDGLEAAAHLRAAQSALRRACISSAMTHAAPCVRAERRSAIQASKLQAAVHGVNGACESDKRCKRSGLHKI